ncbi:radical SAM protein [Mucilaginibacter sp. 44-25]|uniref:radical SAM/SPASM domain-containing protein n=1 Tax=Mucilaginibacter sp. 44-25 TaxID=1895794 RepID=UPI000960C602|nr:radical SAM protein [Mucilaginibacter sp. 44-25]OJW12495.1 MAG: radical SAM/SPASM domain-containing protein [Mucilaginibacter sp. 44-25]
MNVTALMRSVPHRAPDLLLTALDENHAYAVNCSFPNSFRLLNRRQYEILSAIDGINDIETLARKLEITPVTLEAFLLMLQKTELVGFDRCRFSQPVKPVSPDTLNFWIHTTNSCNLGCSYCYISTLNTGKGMSDAVRKQLLFKLTETVRKDGIRQIRLRLAGGEPLGQFGAWKLFIAEARSALTDIGCKFEAGFVTNLTLLNDEIIDFSKAYGIGFGVSLDGLEATHDATRSFRSGCGSFGIVDTNLRKLIAAGVPVSVNTVVTNLNLTGLPDLTCYLVALNIPFRYSIVKGEKIHAELLDEYLTASFAIMGEAIKRGWQFSKRFQFCDLKPNELGFQTCASGFSGGAIYVDGTFKYCHVQFGDDSASGKSIFNEELSLVDMIAVGEHHEDKKSDDCKKCKYRSICTSGCPVYRVDGKDSQCSLYHHFIPKYFELQAMERLNLLHTRPQ